MDRLSTHRILQPVMLKTQAIRVIYKHFACLCRLTALPLFIKCSGLSSIVKNYTSFYFIIEPAAVVSKNYQQSMMDVMDLYLSATLTTEGLLKMLRSMNSVSGANLKFPQTKYLFMKNFDRCFHFSMYIKCADCNCFIQESTEMKCSLCNRTLKPNETNFFMYIPIRQQLEAHILKDWINIKQYRAEMESKNGKLRDVHDSELFPADERDMVLSVTICTDGVSIFKSSTKSLWPIYVILNFLPPNIRFKKENILMVGLYFSESKPIFTEFFSPLIIELIDIERHSISVSFEEVELRFKVQILSCCLDLPARASFQNMTQYNGYHSCPFCYHTGERVNVSKNVKRQTLQIRYTNPKIAIKLRQHEDTIQHINHAITSNEPIYGIKGRTCAQSFTNFNIIHGFPPDYMHNMIGVVHLLFDLWIESAATSSFRLNKEAVQTISNRIVKIKPPSFISRTPRGLMHRALYKANELRSLLLYYLPVCLMDILPVRYVDHFQLLSAAIYILLGTNITDNDLDEAEKKLRKFVEQFEQYYGKASMRLNVHILSHLVESCRKAGPLWTHSMFCFENYNGEIRKFINGNTDVVKQITMRYCLKKAYKDLVPKASMANKDVLLGRESLLKLNGRPLEMEVLRNMGVPLENDQSILTWARLSTQNITYTSEKYERAKKYIDYFITTINHEIGIAKYYFEFDHEKYVMLDKYQIIGRKDHLYKVAKSNEILHINIQDIACKVIYIKTGAREYITFPPNKFETD